MSHKANDIFYENLQESKNVCRNTDCSIPTTNPDGICGRCHLIGSLIPFATGESSKRNDYKNMYDPIKLSQQEHLETRV